MFSDSYASHTKGPTDGDSNSEQSYSRNFSKFFLTLFNFTKFERLEVEAVLPSATLGLILQRTPKLSLQLKLHAFLLWSLVGFLMPKECC
jgi:hypothetical protein